MCKGSMEEWGRASRAIRSDLDDDIYADDAFFRVSQDRKAMHHPPNVIDAAGRTYDTNMN